MMRIFSRQQFHELVWTKPMTHLAKEFGLSDVALHKVCRKHDIPTPPPGWWAKKAAGKTVSQAKLPKLRDGIADRVVITGGELRREPEALAVVREDARVLASAEAPESIPVHPIVDRTIAKLRKSKPGPTGLMHTGGPGLIRCEVAPSSIGRLEVALPRILAAAQVQRFRCRSAEGRVVFSGADEAVCFGVSEMVRRVKHELTKAEQALLEKWQRKHDRLSGVEGIHWSIQRPRFAEWDYHPTGRLSFELEHDYGGSSPRRTFRDGKVQRLEDMAGDIAVGIAVIAAAKTQNRRDREAVRVWQDEQRRLREQALRAKHVEDRRAADFDQILGVRERVERMETLLCGLRATRTHGKIEPRVGEFLRWAEDRLVSEQEGLSAEGMARRFGEARLFGEDDDHAFVRWSTID